jgi:hypothetical protein
MDGNAAAPVAGTKRTYTHYVTLSKKRLVTKTTYVTACFDKWKTIGGALTTAKWFSTAANVTSNRHKRSVRRMVSVNTGTVTIYWARVKVVYGVLE